MASRTTRPNGHTWCFCKGPAGKRHTVRMGVLKPKEAAAAELYLDSLEEDNQLGRRPDKQTQAWLDSLSGVLHARVAATGLVPPRAGAVGRRGRGAAASTERPGTLAYLIEQFPRSLTVKEQTRTNISRTAECLRRYFGADRRLDAITAGDADDFAAWLHEHGRKKSKAPLSRSTVGRRVQEAKRMFRYAARHQWIADNPFAHIKSRYDVNRTREVYVAARLVEELVAVETDPEMRLKLSIARWMGLRHDSEFRSLTWDDVDWEHNYLRVTAPKTEAYDEGGLRDVPIHAKVRPLLDALWEQAPPRATLLFPRLASVKASASTDRLERLCRWVGVPLWSRAWNNLRASCETDWLKQDGCDIFTVAAYMGHSPEVALRHYNRVVKERTPRGVADLPPKYHRRASPFASGLVGEARTDQRRSKRRSNQESPSGDSRGLKR